MNKFNTAAATLATLTNLVARAEALFGTAAVVGVQAYLHDRTVCVQMKEADLLAWCAERGLTPDAKAHEQDYRPWGGGFTTFRQMEVVVEGTPELGRILLISSEVESRRPAHPSTEQGESVAVA